MAMSVRVLYFTMVDVGRTDGGGGLICRHHIRQIAQAEGVTLTVCATGLSTQYDAEAEYAASVGAAFFFIPFRASTALRHSRWPFLQEATAYAQSHVDGEVAAVMDQARPDVLVIDYVPSALFVRSAYVGRIPRITITLNSEARFYRDLRRHHRVPGDASASWVANWRAARFERWVYRRSHLVVSLTEGDLAAVPMKTPRAVMPPLFPPVEQQWAPAGRGCVFFVGNIGYYPNALAIEWLATRLAPALESTGSRATLRVVGVAAEGVSSHWLRPNVEYLGLGDRRTVENEFAKSDLFVAPISNAFGSKIKVLECLAHGTPIAATREALSGLPFLHNVPIIELDWPQRAAETVVALLAEPAKLRALSACATTQITEQIKKQAGQWERLLRKVARAGAQRSGRAN
jgi:glycosyltransferase involved in cell wall biosynthesis